MAKLNQITQKKNKKKMQFFFRGESARERGERRQVQEREMLPPLNYAEAARQNY